MKSATDQNLLKSGHQKLCQINHQSRNTTLDPGSLSPLRQRLLKQAQKSFVIYTPPPANTYITRMQRAKATHKGISSILWRVRNAKPIINFDKYLPSIYVLSPRARRYQIICAKISAQTTNATHAAAQWHLLR